MCLVVFQREEFEKFWVDHELTPLTGRNHILSCLCPQVYGLYVVKLAVAMVLAGGVQVRMTGVTTPWPNAKGFYLLLYSIALTTLIAFTPQTAESKL